MLNIPTTITNVAAIYPIYVSYKKGDFLSAAIITYTALASTISHLFESHKHDMPGFGCPKNISFILNRLDVCGCFLIFLRWMFLPKTTKGLFTGFIGFIFLRISEYKKTNRSLYIMTHCIWHILAYYSMGKYLS